MSQDLPNGKEFYQAQIDYYTTSGKTAAEIHDIGLAEVERITRSMEEIAQKRNMTLPQFMQYLRTAEKYYFVDYSFSHQVDTTQKPKESIWNSFGISPSELMQFFLLYSSTHVFSFLISQQNSSSLPIRCYRDT